MLNKEFLKQLDYHREKETYVRLLALNNDDVVREEITGQVTTGSINVDSKASLRRTCSLTMVALESDAILTDAYWSFNNKFKLQIGLKNTIDTNYPEIVWFDMGVFIITSFSSSKSTNNLNISISGQDKMCRLNGSVSGNIMYSTDFGTEEKVIKIYEDNGETVKEYQVQKEKLPIKEIIANAVKVYGQELEQNIIINDLDIYGYELWEYYGDTPMYMFVRITSDKKEVVNITFDENTEVTPVDGEGTTTIDNINKYYSMNILDPSFNDDATQIGEFSGCYVAKIEYGQTAGYHQTPLVYNSDLILNAGETVESLLKKLADMLGNYEYFYDVKGRFVFQKKKTYTQEIMSPINGELSNIPISNAKYSYKFDDEKLFVSISNSPNIGDIKNDFAVWGSKSANNTPLHLRYAIDKKPIEYTTPWPEDHKNQNEQPIDEYSISDYDWRELIYQMAKDYDKHNQDSDFLLKIQASNSQFIDGKTGYEQYYTDMLGFWRDLYNPLITADDEEYKDLYNLDYYGENDKYPYWNKDVYLNPNNLPFWFDFLDTEGELNNFSVKKYDKDNDKFITNIGVRSKVDNNNAVHSIYNLETPEALFVIKPDEEDPEDQNAYTKIQIQDSVVPLFYKSSQGLSAIERMNELLCDHAAIAAGLQITAIPIYYLEPNTRIYIKGYGDYSLDSISYSLSNGSTMNLNCNKIIQIFY